MFIGHLAVALVAKRAAPRASLGTLFAAALLPDIVWPVLVLAGVERVEIRPGDTAFTPLNFVSYPWSHSLLMVLLTGLIVGVGYKVRTKYFAGAIMIPVLAGSHWVLDWITHRPDLPLLPGGPLHGLGLWNSIPGTLIIESGFFVVCLIGYLRYTKSQDWIGRYVFWLLVIVIAAAYAGNLLGPPPPSDKAVALVGLFGGVLLIAWAAWTDRHRRIR
jgi:membrane-bound metal-dependent hydrolase YbcI (DUF457 family)